MGTTLLSSIAIVTADAAGPGNQPPDPQTWHLDLIRAQAAYDRGYTGAGVTVAVGDSGFDLSHRAFTNKWNPALAQNFLVGPDGVYNPRDVTPQFGYDAAGEWGPDSHGTHVSGIIAANIVAGVDMHGVAYNASVIPIRTIIGFKTYGYADDIHPGAAPLDYFASLQNVTVFNASYGPSRPEFKDLAKNQVVWRYGTPSRGEALAAYNVLQAGKIIVAATGNERREDPIAGKNPNGLALFPYYSPAHNDTKVYENLYNPTLDLTALQYQAGQIIGVMSVGAYKQAAIYSNLCGVTASWCVAAPGGDFTREFDGGPNVYSTIPTNVYGAMAGTSMAAPAVSGALAVLIEANPSYNAQDLARLLFSTTEDLGDPGVDAVFGHGLIRLDRATDGPSTLAANATETVAAGSTTYWSQLLQTQGDFRKAGEGILTISGRTNAGGNVFAELGTLAVDGTLSMTAGNKLSIAQPATLAGFGLVNGDTVIAGTLSPGKMANLQDLISNNALTANTVQTGNSIGTLIFNGNVALSSTATTRIDIDGTLNIPGGPRTYDKIYVTGAGNVFYAAGTLTPTLRGNMANVSNFTPAIGTEFQFVQAFAGARTAGSFSTLTQPTDGLPANARFDLIYQPTTISLAVTPSSFGALAAGDSTATQDVARILDKDRAESGAMPTAAQKALYDALYNLDSEAEFDKAVDQLGGAGQPAVAAASLQAFSGFLGAIGNRQDSISFGSEAGQNGTTQGFALSYAGRNTMLAESNAAMNALASLAPAEREPTGWTMWGQGFGRTSRVGDSGDLSGSKAMSAGFTLGADRWFSNNLIAGGAFGYARTTATGTDIKGTSDTYAGAAYASWTPGAAVFDFRIAAGPSQMNTTRQIILASTGLSGSANGIGLGTSFEAGYRFSVTPDVIVKPFVGLDWQGFRRDGYSESQLPIGLVYSAQSYDKLMSTAGAAFGAKLRTSDGTTLVPEVKLGWGYDLRDTTLISQAALLDESFLVTAASPGRSAALVVAKLSGWRTENFRLFGAYNGEFRSNATSHQLSAGVRFNW